jgi:hypothetical protein
MTKLKTLLVAGVASATLAVGGLSAPPSASAMTCAQAVVLAEYYWALGDVEWSLGNRDDALMWYQRSNGVRIGACKEI